MSFYDLHELAKERQILDSWKLDILQHAQGIKDKSKGEIKD